MIESNDKTLKKLLDAIRRKPNDDTARLVLADWIDEHMPEQHALAELYRGGAKQWLHDMSAYCRGEEAGMGYVGGSEEEEEEEYAWFTYEKVLQLAKHAIKNDEPGFHVGNVMSAQDYLHEHMEMFWVCIEVVLGMKVPDNFKTESGFGCAC